jgi:glycosyltransferase involved in cell wall biosynthesis
LVFNNEAFVERTLLSILENNTKYFDVVINNDCSTDNSQLVIERFIKKHKEQTKQWQLNVNKVNVGINTSIKNVLVACKNNWVKYIAGDDEFEPGALAEYYQLAIMNNPQSSIVLSDMNLIDKDSEFIAKRKSLSPYFYESNWLKTANLYINTINAPTVMIGRESLLLALDETKAKNAEDWPVLRFCISRNFDFKVCRKPLIKYRLHQGSLSSSYNSSTKTKKSVNKISDQVEILLNENKFLADFLSARIGIYIQLKILKTDKDLNRLALKALKLVNIQYVIFRTLALIDATRK